MTQAQIYTHAKWLATPNKRATPGEAQLLSRLADAAIETAKEFGVACDRREAIAWDELSPQVKELGGIVAHVAHDRYPETRVLDGTNRIIAHLWDRAESEEVAEAGAKCLYRTKWWLLSDREFDALHSDEKRRLVSEAAEVLFGALTALIGPKPEGENDATE